MRAAVLVGIAFLAVTLAAVVYELSLPGVGNAQARIVRLVRSHRGTVGRAPVPAKLGMAVVAVEDENFYSNIVIDVFEGIARAGLASVSSTGDPGGSTIEQQLAKQLYPQASGISGSMRELGLGVKLGLTYSRTAILAMYLNSIYYGNHYWGYVAAAQGYFGVQPARLDWAQAAMLAGLPQAPSAYDPLHHFSVAKQRQLHVLDQLVVNHDLSKALASTVYRQRLHLVRRGQ
ncbi:MAG TPA: biosynthetic peptidoglycan transglycosylase [Candidatus Dormibacteraeota bacterium]|nr:biosynthetic peptidoglycan transglycosylase [Candidatus Dormibacteraeota bacterium]